MIKYEEVEEEIADLERRKMSLETVMQLAALYTVRDHLEECCDDYDDMGGYSGAGRMRDSRGRFRSMGGRSMRGDRRSYNDGMYMDGQSYAGGYSNVPMIYGRGGYSGADGTRVVSVEGTSEFLKAVNGKTEDELWSVMNEAMDSIKSVQPQLYNAVMRKLKQ